MTKHNVLFLISIVVRFHNSNFNLTLGNSAAIQCLDLSSLVDVTVQWINMDDVNISNNNTLMISNVIPSLHNTVYTCRAVVDTNPENCVSENKTIIINVKGMLLRVIIVQ